IAIVQRSHLPGPGPSSAPRTHRPTSNTSSTASPLPSSTVSPAHCSPTCRPSLPGNAPRNTSVATGAQKNSCSPAASGCFASVRSDSLLPTSSSLVGMTSSLPVSTMQTSGSGGRAATSMSRRSDAGRITATARSGLTSTGTRVSRRFKVLTLTLALKLSLSSVIG
ncbi:unnamed protein product, partial [Protopolystoma xenopodis]